MKKKILLIDGMYLIFSSFYSTRSMRTLKGEPTGAVYGFITRVESFIKEIQPDQVLVALDSPGKNFRHEILPSYKEKRQIPPEELVSQIPLVKEYLEKRNISSFAAPGFEADDIIAGFCSASELSDWDIWILSADKDLFQLVNSRVSIYHPKFKRPMDRDAIFEHFGVYPEQIVDYLSLAGDSSDNIPGIPGVGDKTAQKLLAAHKSIEGVMAAIDQLKGKLKERIKNNLDILKTSRTLVDLSQAPALELPVLEEKLSLSAGSDLADLFSRLSFSSLLKKFDLQISEPAGSLNLQYHTVNDITGLNQIKEKIAYFREFAFDIETTDLDFNRGRVAGISISFSREGFYLPFLVPEQSDTPPLDTELFFREFKGIFADPEIGKIGHNLKFDILFLRRMGFEINGVSHDSMIMSYLLFPNRRTHRLKDLTREFLDYSQVTFDDLVGSGRKQIPISQVPVNKISRYCIEDSHLSLRLCRILEKKLAENSLTDLYRNIEIPLIAVLTEMEFTGVEIDRPFLVNSARQMSDTISRLEQVIYSMAGYELNLNSSQQLGDLLFNKMNLPVTKRTRKTRSYSTDSEALGELRGYPVVVRILEYRKLRKLLSTYLEGLLQAPDLSGRIHSSFNQTITATGRLSSSSPNLQNIPVAPMGGINVRSAFTVSQGKKLLAADYSQVELRVMAHFSRDPNLVKAFTGNFDIHQHTADLVFPAGSDIDPKEKRRRAKIINFSILYGSGPFSLSKELGVSYREARDFIDQYFATYSGVRQFIDTTLENTRKDPVVHTLAGRRRPIPEILSSNRTVKENGQRMAINTIIQGSAADIIKTAMVKIHRRISAMQASLIMQVHDELIFEYPVSEETDLIKLVVSEMEHAVKLHVPLKVSLKTGSNWGELEAF